MRCSLIYERHAEDGRPVFRCRFCRREIASRTEDPTRIKRTCAAAPTDTQRLATFGRATWQHLSRGAPRANQQQIDDRLAICQGCEFYDGSACRQCGCAVSSASRFLNKLAWADQRCPVGKWGPVEVQQPPAGRRWRHPGRPLRVALLVPGMMPSGGVERWAETLRQSLPKERAGLVSIGSHPAYAMADDTDVALVWATPAFNSLHPTFDGPAIVVCHGDNEWSQQMIATAWPGCCHCVAVSEWSSRAVPEGIPYRVIRNGVDLRLREPRLTRAAIRQRWGVPAGLKVAGFYGRFSEEKDALAAVRLARLQPDQWHAVLVCSANTQRKAELATLADRDVATVVPQDNHWGDVHAGFDVAMCVPDHEGFGLAMVEAWAAGCPTVTTPRGVLLDYLQTHGPLSVMVPHRAAAGELLAAAREALRGEHVAAARAVAEQHLSAERFGSEWAAYLESFFE